MFGMGLGELFFIAVIAILFLGPDKLPDAMIQIAKFFRSVKRTVNEAKTSLEEELKVSELKEEAFKYKQQLDQATKQLEEVTTAPLTTLDDLTETVEEVKKSEAHLEEEVEELKEKIEPKREKITFPKKSKVAPPQSAKPKADDATNADAAKGAVTKENDV
ncbi:Sec-independent protein translocase protein TatB [Hydrogenimonas sp.]